MKLILSVVFCLFLINFYYYLDVYWIHTPSERSEDWQYGYREAVETAHKYESSVDRVIVTYAYDQPYIFFLFYDRIDPSWYQNLWKGGEIQRSYRSFGKYEFRKINWEQDSELKNVILIGTPSEIPEQAQGKIGDIRFLDGSVAFRMVAR
jgi:hypothetical protein